MENLRKLQDNEIIIVVERKTFNSIKKYSREGQLAPDVNQHTKKKELKNLTVIKCRKPLIFANSKSHDQDVQQFRLSSHLEFKYVVIFSRSIIMFNNNQDGDYLPSI